MYTKFQLAAQYFPDSIDNAAAAIKRLMRWIDNTQGLMNALLNAGYRRRQHHFTQRQADLIFEYLGDP